jgi:hypothetical protein
MAKFEDVLAPGLTIRESANDGSDFTNPAADYRRLFLGEDGLLYVKDSAGTVTNPFTGAGSVATDAIWDAAGDLVQGTGANTGAKLGAGTAGQFLKSGGAATANSWASRELDYVQKTTNTTLSATSAATANTIVTGNAVAYDGSTAVEIVFSCPTTDRSGGATLIALWQYDGSSEVGALYYSVAATTARVGIYASYRLTPSNASHTYSIRGSVNASSADINAGAAGSGNFMPCYIRILRAV